MLLHYAFILEQVVLVTHKMEEHTWQKCWRNGDNGNVKGWRWFAVLVCNEERKHKKQMEEEWEKTRHCYSTYKDCSGQVHQRVQNTKNTANMHHQWKLTVRTEWQWHSHGYRTQTSYISTVSLQPHCLLERSSNAHFSCSTQKQGRWTSDVTVTVQTPMRTDRNKAYITHSR